MKDSIKKGDEVRLTTGGPLMKVTQVLNDQADCEWTVVNKVVSMRFKVKSLVLETPSEAKK